jgi:hypothetical protein
MLNDRREQQFYNMQFFAGILIAGGFVRQNQSRLRQ